MYAKTDLKPSTLVLNRYRQTLSISSLQLTKDNLAETLRSMAIRHFQKYPMHTVYFNVEGIPINLNRDALIHQLIQNESGSCYHHNAVFQAILEENKISSWFVACLVHNPVHPEETFRIPTHVAIVFEHEGMQYLFDPGWDGTVFSIYPLPSTSGEILRHLNHQVRKTDHPEFPFTFEVIHPDGTITPKYDFNSVPTPLLEFSDALNLLSSSDYAFYTLFFFSQINAAEQIIRVVNRRLSIENLNGEVIYSEDLAEDVSPLQKLAELLGPHVGLMEMLSDSDFKNPALGRLVCHAPAETHTIEGPK